MVKRRLLASFKSTTFLRSFSFFFSLGGYFRWVRVVVGDDRAPPERKGNWWGVCVHGSVYASVVPRQ